MATSSVRIAGAPIRSSGRFSSGSVPRLRFVFRHFPLTKIHSHAQHAAEAAEAAAAQGYFHEMHAALFRNQRALSDRDLVAYAIAIGLDGARFQEELAAHTYARRVREDFLSGVRSGVNGTPTFFINGQRHDGAWESDALMRAVEAAAETSELARG